MKRIKQPQSNPDQHKYWKNREKKIKNEKWKWGKHTHTTALSRIHITRCRCNTNQAIWTTPRIKHYACHFIYAFSIDFIRMLRFHCLCRFFFSFSFSLRAQHSESLTLFLNTSFLIKFNALCCGCFCWYYSLNLYPEFISHENSLTTHPIRVATNLIRHLSYLKRNICCDESNFCVLQANKTHHTSVYLFLCAWVSYRFAFCCCTFILNSFSLITIQMNCIVWRVWRVFRRS